MEVRIDQPDTLEQHASHVGATVISLMFHDVTDKPASSGFLQPSAQRYKHTRHQFRTYLNVVKKSGLDVLTGPDDVSMAERSGVVFTFDDGGSSAMLAADLLEECNWRGTFLITTDLIDTPGFLTQRQIFELYRRGHVIGTHSCSHPDIFRLLTWFQKFTEWNKSREKLEQIIGERVTVASIPGGDGDRATIEAAAAARLDALFTSEWSVRPWLQTNVMCFGRAWMLRSTTPQTLSRWLRHPKIGLSPERSVRVAKNAAKALMGPVYQRIMRQRRAVHEQS